MCEKNTFFLCRNPQLNPLTYGALALHWLYIALVLHCWLNMCSTLVSNWYWLQCCMNCVSASSAIQPSIYPEATLLHNNLYSYLWNLLAQTEATLLHNNLYSYLRNTLTQMQHYSLSNISYSSLKSRKYFFFFIFFLLHFSSTRVALALTAPRFLEVSYIHEMETNTQFPVSFLHSGISIRVKFSNTITCMLLCPISNQTNGYHCGKIVGSTLQLLLY